MIGSLLEDRPRGYAIAVLLEDRPSRSLLSVHRLPCPQLAFLQPEPGPAASHLRQVKLAIARRVLESAGAQLDFYCDTLGFLVRIPVTQTVVHQLSA